MRLKRNFTQLIAQDDASSNRECRSGDSSADDDNDWNSDDDNHREYEVESIEGFRFKGDVRLLPLLYMHYRLHKLSAAAPLENQVERIQDRDLGIRKQSDMSSNCLMGRQLLIALHFT